MLEMEVAELKERLAEEQVKSHAKATKDIYEDVRATLSARYKSETIQKAEEVKKEMQKDFEVKLRKLENRFEAQLAHERVEKGRLELQNAKLESELSERRTVEQSDKENAVPNN